MNAVQREHDLLETTDNVTNYPHCLTHSEFISDRSFGAKFHMNVDLGRLTS